MKPWLVAPAKTEEGTANYTMWLERHEIAVRVADSGASVKPGAFSALVLLGGGDVDPREYGEARDPHTCLVSRERDRMDIGLAKAFLSAHIPVFGICRGAQVIQVALGGRLIQHLPPGVLERHRGERDVVHPVRPVAGSRLGSALAGAADVNSTHHQALDPADLGRGLAVAAWSDDGVIEAVEGTETPSPVSAVQWHPERLPEGHPASNKVLAVWRSIAGFAGRP